MLRLILGASAVLLAFCAGRAGANPSTQPLPTTAPADAGLPGEIILTLEGALRGQHLTVHLDSRGGKWTEAWAEAPDFNQVLHTISVAAAEHRGPATELKLGGTIRDDFWVKGGPIDVEVKLQRRPIAPPVLSRHARLRTVAATHAYEGTYASTVWLGGKQYAIKGRAEGVRLPPRDAPAGFVPVASMEHPRLLMRKADVPRLRERLNTPLGKAVLQHLKTYDHEVAEAIVYQLTGDRAWARKAWDRIATGLKSDKGSKTRGYGGIETEHTADFIVGHQITAAMAFDLCYDELNADERHEMLKWLAAMCEFDTYRPWTYSNTGYTGGIKRGGALVFSGGVTLALTLWGIKGPAPEEPRETGASGLALLRPDWVKKPMPLAERRRLWELQMRTYEAAGGMDLSYFAMMRYARQAMSVLINENFGEGGHWGNLPMLDSAIAYQKVMGTDLTGRPDLSHAVLVPMMHTVGWFETRGTMHAAGPGGEVNVSPKELARYLALSPDSLRGAVKDYWLRRLNLRPADLQTEEGARLFVQRSFDVGGTPDACGPLYALLYMPGPPEPAPYDQVVPRVSADLARGEFSFVRRDPKPAIIELDAGANSPVGTFSAGDFAIWGLGTTWARSQGGSRTRQSVIELPGEWTSGNAFGQITHLHQDPATGGGTITVNLDACYKIRESVRGVREEVRKNAWVTTTRPVEYTYTAARDRGIRATRAFAVDYSGQCGAPALFVMADRVTGPKNKVWVMNVPALRPPARRSSREPWTPGVNVEIEPQGFTLRNGAASLRATFVSPVGVKLRQVTGQAIIDRADVEPSKRNILDQRYGIEAVAPDGTCGEFLVVFTLQEGDAPAVKAEKAALDALVSIGRRTIRFDGEKMVLGDVPEAGRDR